jgi:hypothetical protein
MAKSLIAAIGVAAAFALAPIGATAHHSAAPFNFNKPVSVTGTVQLFRVVNPHSHIVLRVTDPKGTRSINFEGHSASNFMRAGFDRGSVKAGDRVSITYAPRHDGGDGGFVLSFVTPGGKTVGFAPER